MAELKKNQLFRIEIEDAAFEGKGIGHLDGMAVFIRNTAPGEVVDARIHKIKKKYCEALLEEIITPSPLRVHPKCRYAEVCGGCSWQHLAYPEQVKIKTAHIRDHLQRIGHFTNLPIASCIKADNIFYYRNKMEYSFGPRLWLPKKERHLAGPPRRPYCPGGLHPPGRFDLIINIEECHLQTPLSFKILAWLRDYAEQNKVPPFNPEEKQGFLRNLSIRNGINTSEVMINIVTFFSEPRIFQPLATALQRQFPEITTIVNNINNTASPITDGRHQKNYHGTGYITEKLGDLEFRIEANTFFQPNPEQAEKLYAKAVEFAELSPQDIVYDLYCGTGALTLFLAQKAAFAVGLEISRNAIEKAKGNAARNNISNCLFKTGDMKKIFQEDQIRRWGIPDVIVADPPRAGLHPQVIKQILEIRPRRFVYISCDSGTLARDLQSIAEAYHITAIQPIDMFPQSYHIETAAKLELKTADQ